MDEAERVCSIPRGHKMITQVEHVARAFYDAESDGQSWDKALEAVKDGFRLYAREAITLHQQLQQQKLAKTDETASVNISKAA
jgi:hypothetical protein